MGYIHNLSRDHRPLILDVGKGKPGLKTMALRNDMAAIEKNNLYFPDHIALTPNFFQRFLWDSGALNETDLNKKYQKVKNGTFTPKELKQIKDSVMSFDFLLRYVLMIRSDDWPVGIGLEESIPTCIPYKLMGEKEGDYLLLQKVESAIKQVLASQFNQDAQEFKKLKGIEDFSGVQIMPFWGEQISVTPKFEDSDIRVITPLFCANILGPINGKYLVSVGNGIGGANSNLKKVRFEKDIYILDSNAGDLARRFCLEINSGAVNRFEIGRYVRMFSTSPIRNRGLDTIEKDLVNFTSEVGPRWIEIVAEDILRPNWVVVQSAQIDYKPIERPEIENERILFKSHKCSGSKVVTTGNIIVNRAGDKNQIAKNNGKNKDYILVLNDTWGAGILETYNLSMISNAIGIILISKEIINIFQSHLNGWIREINIPIIGIESSRNDQLIEKIKNGGKITLYCNEFMQEGFVATEK